MSAGTFVRSYLVCAVVLVALDALWLGAMAQRLYRPALGHLLREQFAIAPVAVFYLLYIGGVVFFAVAPARGRWQAALCRGALLGLQAYATYDLTNQATLKDWPWPVTLADLCWGSFLTAVSAAATCRLVAARMP